MRMRILFLDDDEERHRKYRERSAGHDVWHVHGAQQAIAALRASGPFDVADLDHDLEGLQMVEPGTPGHGLDVARFIAENPACARLVVLHTFNEPAAMAMLEALGEAPVAVAYAPFGTWSPTA